MPRRGVAKKPDLFHGCAGFCRYDAFMSGLRTFLVGLIGFFPFGSATASDDALRTFASCAGRLSAVMEHQWLMSHPDADHTRAQRTAMLSLVEAAMAPHQDRQVLAWRIEAKQAHSVLLTRATFNDNADDASWAMKRARTQLAACTGLLLS